MKRERSMPLGIVPTIRGMRYLARWLQPVLPHTTSRQHDTRIWGVFLAASAKDKPRYQPYCTPLQELKGSLPRYELTRGAIFNRAAKPVYIGV